MQTKNLSELLLSFAIIFMGCNSGGSSTQAMEAKIDSTYSQIADLSIEQYKIKNKMAPDSRITAEIQEYEKAKAAPDKFNVISSLDNQSVEDNLAHCPRVLDMRFKLFTLADVIGPQAFDLAILSNDVVVQQVKMMNSHFRELDTSTVNAISFYEKLSPAEKKEIFFSAGNPKPIPYPALNYYFQEAYYLQRLNLYQRLNRYLLQRTFINEFPQGYIKQTDIGFVVDDKQFDLKL